MTRRAWLCGATTRKGKPCPLEPSYVDHKGRPWCHVHADRSRCRPVAKGERKRRSAAGSYGGDK